MIKKFLILILFTTTFGFAQYGYRDGNRIGISAGLSQTTLFTNNFNATPELGFAGGLSTFSAYVGQTVNYWRKGRLIQGVLNTVLQFGLPSTAVYLVALWCAPLIN